MIPAPRPAARRPEGPAFFPVARDVVPDAIPDAWAVSLTDGAEPGVVVADVMTGGTDMATGDAGGATGVVAAGAE
jgi:hypothetical protein